MGALMVVVVVGVHHARRQWPANGMDECAPMGGGWLGVGGVMCILAHKREVANAWFRLKVRHRCRVRFSPRPLQSSGEANLAANVARVFLRLTGARPDRRSHASRPRLSLMSCGDRERARVVVGTYVRWPACENRLSREEKATAIHTEAGRPTGARARRSCGFRPRTRVGDVKVRLVTGRTVQVVTGGAPPRPFSSCSVSAAGREGQALRHAVAGKVSSPCPNLS